MMARIDRAKLHLWQERLGANVDAYSGVEAQMDAREALYLGEKRSIEPLTAMDTKKDGTLKKTPHIRNIVAENIESQVNSSIPQPKVTARRKKDERKAKLIEDMLRNELNRLPFEAMNDQMERTVPIQGGGLWLVEWDNTQRTHTTVGEVAVSTLHPKQVVPQDGVYTGIEDMDYIILKLPQTKEGIRRKYGVELDDEGESEPEVKGSGDASPADDMVTQYVAYYRNESGGIGLYSWCNDVQLEDLEDYQARRLRRCAQCGALEPLAGTEYITMAAPADGGLGQGAETESNMAPRLAAELLAGGGAGEYATPLPMAGDPGVTEVEEIKVEEGVCPYCGGREWKESAEDYEEIYLPIMTPSGMEIPGATIAIDANGQPYEKPTRIPFYKPNVYPVVLQKNVSVYGRFLGDSDVDKIRDQQNTVNRLEMKIIDRLIKAGTRITLPDNATFRVDPEDGERWYIGNAADKACIGSYEFSGNLQYEVGYLASVYEEARQALGITDSFQGRQDSTATSGVAKQFAAAQSAGRMESKRVMKDAAYAELFRLIFLFRLAYADEPRPVTSKTERGETEYNEFSRYDFLEVDDNGEYYWNDQFLFACDASAPLANNREKMWENTTAHLQAGAYGDPAQIDTLILYWTRMDLLHYPGAGETKTYLEEKKKAQEVQMAQQQMMLQQQMAQQQMAGGGAPPEMAPPGPAAQTANTSSGIR